MVTDQLNHLNTRLAKLGHHIDQLKPAKNWFRHVFPVGDHITWLFKVFLIVITSSHTLMYATFKSPWDLFLSLHFLIKKQEDLKCI